MRPIPFQSTQEAWFLRPNLENRMTGPFMPAPNQFAKQDHVNGTADLKPLYKCSGKVLLTVKNETFYSNKFSTPIYTYSINKQDKCRVLFGHLATKLMVDPKLFYHENKTPEGLNVFLHYDEPVQGTKMCILDENKTIASYGLTKNSKLLLKYRFRQSKY